MVITIIILAMMVAPFLALARAETENTRKKEKWLEREKAARENPQMLVSMEVVRNRWPFVSLWELYIWKKHNNPAYGKSWSADTIRELRMERQEEIRRCLKGR